ncbi:MAG: nucleoside-diphosphate sugar epimerase/dehydratase [Candidatus Limiplasma sp.]|nr:nucleoside-diphosphate sugar epimerase/dehydratase [Candidatus Limiplasma sp.]MEA5145783.1 nucleoside-diphosphate sugar epimerase/dehydratase [Candidatus Limiplasma sp.]
MTVRKAKLNSALRTVLWLLLDVALCNAAMILAQQFRFEVQIPEAFFQRYLNLAPVMTLLCLLSFWAFGLYRSMWQYASISSVVQIVAATLVGAVATYLFSLGSYAFTQPRNLFLLHRMVYLLFWVLLTATIGGSRLLYRIIRTRGLYPFRRGAGESYRRTLVVGAGWAGANLINEMKNGRYHNSLPVAIVDDDPLRAGATLSGVRVLHDTARIPQYVKDYSVDDIIIAIATPNGELRPLIETCLSTGCRVRRVSALQDVSNEGTQSAVRDVNIGDLLGRPEEQLNMTQAADYFRGKTVLITGGGGSIGSELCRQLMAFQPQKLVLFDISENYMYDLFFELQEHFPNGLRDKLILCVGSIQDGDRLSEVMAQHRPDVVLHAAAHKHVPLMEDCPTQAVKNNVFGTYTAATVAIAHGVKRFVMISTDKAVNPTNVMGATKRLSEMIIQALNAQGKTEFTAVRFGNVLGSHGSVVPLFERQIRSGGPVTLTHPDIIRYFMTIPEAASLVLKAASIAQGGELFVLDMGRPVRIQELAQRMIQLYGAQGGTTDVPIVYTGLRPGEKLYEELLMDDENIVRTGLDKIFITKPDVITWEAVESMLQTLQTCVAENGDMRACLHSLLPSFQPPEVVNSRVAPQTVDSAEASEL